MAIDYSRTSPVTDMIGTWSLVATTASLKFLDPGFGRGVSDGTVEFHLLDPARIGFTATFHWVGRKTRQVKGIAPLTANKDGLYSWKGKGRGVLATGSKWAFALTQDGSIAAIHHPGSWLSNAGAFIVRKQHVSPNGALATTALHYRQLLLTEDQFQNLIWRA